MGVDTGRVPSDVARVTGIRPADPAVAAEFDSFLAMLPRLRESHAGEFVAVRGGRVVASGAYLDPVLQTAKTVVGAAGFYCGWVEPAEGYVFRVGSPTVVGEAGRAMSLRLSFAPLKNPPVPVVTVDLVSPDGSQTVAGIAAIVDTAADRTVIPLSFLHQLKLRSISQARAQGFGTAVFVVDIYHLRIVIPNVCDVAVHAIEHANEPHILLGRDVLNQLCFTFDGPNQFIEFP